MATLDRTSLNSNADTRIPDNTSEQVTPANERQQFKDLADSCLNKVTDKGIDYAVPKQLSGTISAGTTTLLHSTGHRAQLVQFKDVDGWPIQLPWRVKPTEETTKIEVVSIEEIENVTINLICFTAQ